MSREEAIEILKTDGCSDCTWGCETPLKCDNRDCHLPKALEMAISTLEQEPCEDAISRADAQTEIMMFAGNEKNNDDIYIKVSDAVQLLRELPSVLPKVECDDAIRREDAINKIQHAEINFTITSTIDFSEYKKEIQEIIDHIVEAQTNAIKQLPSVTPSRRKGDWINDKNDMPICSRCGYIPQYDRAIDDYEYSNYCPSCGAEMESEE